MARVIADAMPDARHNTVQDARNRVGCDQGRLKPGSARCGLKTDRTARVIIGGHTFIQNLRRVPPGAPGYGRV